MSLAGKALTAGRIVAGLARRVPNLLERYRFPASAERLLDSFTDDPVPNTAYDDLMRYFATSWATYRNATASGATFPGLPSWSGSESDSLEGFSRMMPLFGAWCASGRSPEIDVVNGLPLVLPDEFRRGLVAGTDPEAATYWGDMPGPSNQRIVEAADIALSVWLFRNTVWKRLADAERQAVVDWLSLVDGRPGRDNNWHLFFVLIDRILTSLGYPRHISGALERFNRIKEFHVGDGWFSDGPGRRFDFYNAWGFHYALTWISRIDPEWDPAFIRIVQSMFLKSYRYLIGPEGFPVLGRSVHYRIAVASPLVAGAESNPENVSPGLARRALDVTWRYFITHGALRRGIVTQGYHGTDARILDPYAGPASSLWSLRSLVLAFSYEPDHRFWRATAEPLPVETGNYDVTLTAPGWRVTGERATGAIAIEVLANAHDACPGLEPFGPLRTLRNFACGTPRRPRNSEARYERRVYRSDAPFWTVPAGSSRDRTVLSSRDVPTQGSARGEE